MTATSQMPGTSLAEFQYEIGSLLGRGEWASAAAVAASCRAAWPDDAAGWHFGSIAALLADDKETALALVTERLALYPEDVQCLLQKAECLLALGMRSASLAACAAAVAGETLSIEALDAAGEFLVHAGEHRRALEVYHRALESAPKSASLHGKCAELHRFLGNFDLAAADYDFVLAESPGNPDALKGLTELRTQSIGHNSVADMESALAGLPTASKEAATLHFALSKSYDDLGNYAGSWRHLEAGNRLERARIQYKPNTDRAVVERIIAGFPTVEARSRDSTGERPIFILGLPRTGTTLVERILGSHSAVHSAGELPALSEAISHAIEQRGAKPASTWLQYAAALGELDGPSIAGEYLLRARARRGDRTCFSDKQPTNFLYCALILRAFPDAPIVHLTRHPLAACYAIYKTRFGGTYPFAYDLDELATFYIGYRRLMDHWNRILPGRILNLAYEDIVKAQERTSRRLLEYVGLPFEPGCLDFHLNPASAVTASSVQVRQPLYESSLHRWRHYAAELAPLRARLEAAGIPID